MPTPSELIEAGRRRRGWTRRDLARAAAVPEQLLHSLATNRHLATDASVRDLAAIADALGIDLGALLKPRPLSAELPTTSARTAGALLLSRHPRPVARDDLAEALEVTLDSLAPALDELAGALATAGLALTANSAHEYAIVSATVALPRALSERLTAAQRRRTGYTTAELSLLVEIRDGNTLRLGEGGEAAAALIADDLIEVHDTTGYLHASDDITYSLEPARRR